MDLMSQKQNRERQALIVIDVQEGFNDTAFWGNSSNPECEDKIETLLTVWRAHDWPIIVVRHDSESPESTLHPSQDGNRLMSFIADAAPSLFVTKQVNSAFYGDPALHEWLQAHDIEGLVVCGIQTNMCVETTARMAGNLGYDVVVPLDATRTFDLTTTVPGLGTISRSADELMATTALNLQAGGFARIATTEEITASLQ